MIKKYYAKPLNYFDNFRVGNLYNFRETENKEVIEIENNKKEWVRMGIYNFEIVECVFNDKQNKN